MNSCEPSPRRISISIDVAPDVDAQHLAGCVLHDVLSRLACEEAEVHWVSLDIAGPLTTT